MGKDWKTFEKKVVKVLKGLFPVHPPSGYSPSLKEETIGVVGSETKVLIIVVEYYKFHP